MMATPAKNPLVSIITVNYNQAKVTGEFLTSISQITYPNYEVIVVDNASTAQGLDILIASFQHVKFIKSLVNTGFAGGNNLGVKIAKGEFILFLNNDTEVEKGFLEPLIACIQSGPTIGMVSPKIKYFDKNDIIQYAGGTTINPFTGRGKFIGNQETDSEQYQDNKPTQLIHGAAMMVSRRLINTIGLMEEAFFLYYEELDWCERAKKAGFSLYFVGESIVYHKESISVGKNSPLRTYYITRNRLLFMRRNYIGFTYWIGMLFFILVSFPKNCIHYLLKGRFDLLKAFVMGSVWQVRHYKNEN